MTTEASIEAREFSMTSAVQKVPHGHGLQTWPRHVAAVVSSDVVRRVQQKMEKEKCCFCLAKKNASQFDDQ